MSVSHTATTGDFFTVAKKEAPLRYEIVFEANTTALERDVTLTFEGLNASDVSFSPAVTTAITITPGGRRGSHVCVYVYVYA